VASRSPGAPPTWREAIPQACDDLATSGAARPPLSPIDPAQFQQRLTVAALGLLLVVLLGFILYVCASILQPLFIAGLLVYLILPAHQRLVKWRVPSAVAYLLIVVCVLRLFWGIGDRAYRNFAELSDERLSVYEERLDRLVRKALGGLPFAIPDLDNWHVRNLLTFDVGPDSRIRNVFRADVGNFLKFLTATFVVLLYLIFLIAERVSLPGRLARAFGEARAYGRGRGHQPRRAQLHRPEGLRELPPGVAVVRRARRLRRRVRRDVGGSSSSCSTSSPTSAALWPCRCRSSSSSCSSSRSPGSRC
jgi:hypothetical protein